jgi:hypothetical protein
MKTLYSKVTRVMIDLAAGAAFVAVMAIIVLSAVMLFKIVFGGQH